MLLDTKEMGEALGESGESVMPNAKDSFEALDEVRGVWGVSP